MSIALFVNPKSRANRRNPRAAGELASILGDAGRVLAPRCMEDLRATVARLRGEPPSVVVVHGGDGTLHRVVTALVEAWQDDALPPIAPLCGGTMNVVASSLGIRARPDHFLRRLVAAERGATPIETIRRRCLRVGNEHGFVFANGLAANFLEEYYSHPGYGAGRAAWLLLRCFLSAVWGGPLVRRVFRRFRGRAIVDGRPLDPSSFVALSAATVREVGLGFKLNHRADEDPDRFCVVAVHAGPLALALDLWPVHRGRGLSPAHGESAVASSLLIEPEGEMLYTVDGDLYRAREPLRIEIGPPVRFVKPAPGRGVRAPCAASPAPPAPSPTSSPLLGSTGGDTIPPRA